MPRVFELSIQADLGNLKKVRSFITKAGQSLGVNAEVIGDMCLVVDEAVTNVILHGYDGQEGPVDIDVEGQDRTLVITIKDQARSFNPEAVEEPHLEDSLADRAYGGMGVYLINKLTDEAEFRRLPGKGNQLRLLKHEVVADS
jgi:anti-sigma regulatory factor (Ser/Thr protein kinase)